MLEAEKVYVIVTEYLDELNEMNDDDFNAIENLFGNTIQYQATVIIASCYSLDENHHDNVMSSIREWRKRKGL